MIRLVLCFVVALFSILTTSSETQPTSDHQFIWEFVNCVQDSTGYQTSEAWGYNPGNLPGHESLPDWKWKVHQGETFFWEDSISEWADDAGNDHRAYIFANAGSNNDGPQGIQISSEGTGLWAWYGSGDAPRVVGSAYSCHAVYWTMQLPHAVLQTTFTGTQSICEYQGNFQSTMSSLGLDSNSISQSGAYSFTDTKLYAQSDCCHGYCCQCAGSCGGEIGNNINIGLTGRQGEIDSMLARLAIDGNGQSTNAPCNCYCPDNGCPSSFGNYACPAQPPPGSNVPQNGWVGIIYGPFTDGSGQYALGNGGEAYIEYQLYEQPPMSCTGAIIGVALNILEEGALDMLTGDVGGTAGELLSSAGTAIANVALQCAGVTS